MAIAMEVTTGELQTIKNFPSQFITSRPVHIWLPDGYSNDQLYSVLYMHDGQMLFDASVTWNKQDWGADETAAQLNQSENIKNFIIVAIENINELRWLEYFPQKSLTGLTNKKEFKELGINPDDLKSDNYLQFIVKELKPYIDKNYSVATDRQNTFIAGSSMGGLISMYALLEYPEVFGGAGCISTHWPGRNPEKDTLLSNAILDYLKSNLPEAKHHKIYFDYGDQTLDAYYPPLQKRADEIMQRAGYQSTLWSTRYFKGHAHDENAWKSRLAEPFSFLLGK